MKRQAERFGAEIRIGDVADVELNQSPLRMTLNGELVETKSLIVATGASARLLDVPGEREFFGRGVSTCATGDSASFIATKRWLWSEAGTERLRKGRS